MKFVCKYCNKTYSCGKALGGHLSSHKMATPDYDIPDYDRELEVDDDDDEFVRVRGGKAKASVPILEGHVCKECGKGFQSLKALCGHMACHSDKDRPGSSRQRYEDNRRRSLFWDGEECCDDAAEDDSGGMQQCRRSKRVRCMNRSGKFSDGFSSFISGMTTVEEVARCLMMMSNDRRTVTGCWGRVGDYSGSHSGESDDRGCSSPRSSDEISFEPKRTYKKLDRIKTFSPEKRHNARKGGGSSNNNNKHECPICFRVFKSGQAMGGHKRSHFLGGVEEVSASQRGGVVPPEAHPLIDLNFPAFLEEGDGDRDELLPW